MWRRIVTAAAVLYLHQVAVAEEYLVSIESRERTEMIEADDDAAAAVERPRPATLEEIEEDPVQYRLEVVVREDQPFQTRAIVGDTTLQFNGILRRNDDGKLRIEMQYSQQVDTGHRVPTVDGGETPVFDELGASTSLSVKLDESVVASGFITTEATDGVPLRRHTREHILLKVARWTTP